MSHAARLMRAFVKEKVGCKGEAFKDIVILLLARGVSMPEMMKHHGQERYMMNLLTQSNCKCPLRLAKPHTPLNRNCSVQTQTQPILPVITDRLSKCS
jgi:hypothetical protein